MSNETEVCKYISTANGTHNTTCCTRMLYSSPELRRLWRVNRIEDLGCRRMRFAGASRCPRRSRQSEFASEVLPVCLGSRPPTHRTYHSCGVCPGSLVAGSYREHHAPPVPYLRGHRAPPVRYCVYGLFAPPTLIERNLEGRESTTFADNPHIRAAITFFHDESGLHVVRSLHESRRKRRLRLQFRPEQNQVLGLQIRKKGDLEATTETCAASQ